MKLTTRFRDPSQVDKIRKILASNARDLDTEVQQRAVEYGNLFAYDEIRRGVLEKMPPPQIKEESRVLGEAAKGKKGGKGHKSKPSMKKNTEEDLLFDLMGGESDKPVLDLSATIQGRNNTDLLADILGGSSISPQPPAGQEGGRSGADDIMAMFGGGRAPSALQQSSAPSQDLFSSPAKQSTPQPSSTHPCYSKNNLEITLQVQRNAEGVVAANARFINTGDEQLNNVGLQAAVPKTQKLTLSGISSASINAGQQATQGMRVIGVKGVSGAENILFFQDKYTDYTTAITPET